MQDSFTLNPKFLKRATTSPVKIDLQSQLRFLQLNLLFWVSVHCRKPVDWTWRKRLHGKGEDIAYEAMCELIEADVLELEIVHRGRSKADDAANGRPLKHSSRPAQQRLTKVVSEELFCV